MGLDRDAVGRREAEAIVLSWTPSVMALQSTTLEELRGVADEPQAEARLLMLRRRWICERRMARTQCVGMRIRGKRRTRRALRQTSPLFFARHDKRGSVHRPFVLTFHFVVYCASTPRIPIYRPQTLMIFPPRSQI